MPIATLHRAEVLFDACDTSNLGLILEQVLDRLEERGKIDAERRAAIEAAAEERPPSQPEDLGRGVGRMRVELPAGEPSITALIRVTCDDLYATDNAELHYLWVVFTGGGEDEPDRKLLSPLGWMLTDSRYVGEALGARTDEDLIEVYERYLADIKKPPKQHALPPELERSGRFLGGLVADIKRRAPHYLSDFVDGFHPQALASILFLFFACLAPAVAFGGLLSNMTQGQVGAVEMILATTICGTIYALFSGQPLTILGSTGPVVIFMGILYSLCDSLGIAHLYLPVLSWVGIWTMVLLVILAVTEASSLISHFTRFTDETFAALISVIFIVEAIKDILKAFTEGEMPREAALISLMLALGTLLVANQLSRFRQTPYLRRRMREFFADFGPAIAIVLMTGVALYLRPEGLATLSVPAEMAPSVERSWLVNPFDAPRWIWGAAIVPAFLVSILLYLDQNITVRLVNDPANKLKKGAGYHLDLLIVGLLVGACSFLGLPWMVAATVRSLNHTRSLTTTETHGGKEQVVGVRENRLTGLVVHLLVGVSLFFLEYLRQVPMSVLFGLFLFMGIASMKGNQLFERLRLWVMDPEMYPPTHYLKRVPAKVVHAFTFVQLLCLGLLWGVKASPLGILFPLFIGLLVPVRKGLDKVFKAEHLAFLDAEEAPEEEKFLELD